MEVALDLDLDYSGNMLPPKNDKIALIDADTVAYIACLAAEEVEELLPESFYTTEEWAEITANPTWDPEKYTITHSNPEVRMQKAEEKIQKILDGTGCQEVELHFTSGRCFRYDVYADYKANRPSKRPHKLSDMKEGMIMKWCGSIHTRYEADDIVVYLKNKYPDKYILCSIDKDVYNATEGRHYNYYESTNRDMCFVDTTAAFAKYWAYAQCILGDPTDNIKGAHRIGIKSLHKWINEDMTEQELWEGVVGAWLSKDQDIDDAIITMNLVNMKLLDDNDNIRTWKPIFNKEGEHIYD